MWGCGEDTAACKPGERPHQKQPQNREKSLRFSCAVCGVLVQHPGHDQKYTCGLCPPLLTQSFSAPQNSLS